MLEQFLSSKWALEPIYHDRMAQIIMNRLAGGHNALTPAHERAIDNRKDPYFVSIQSSVESGAKPKAGFGYDRLQKAKTETGQVVILPILGTMSRYGDYCSYGTEQYASWILEANLDPSVSAIVLELNTPGGQVDGTEYLGEVIRTSAKPIVSYVAGMGASAGYWIASQTKKIVMESRTSSEVGSIGVLAMHVDATKAYEKEGYKITIVRADGSQDKALFNSVEPLSDAILSETRDLLNAIRQTFIDVVKSGRPGISNDVFSGKMYMGRDAIKLKMADQIGFLGDAIQLANDLARKAA